MRGAAILALLVVLGAGPARAQRPVPLMVLPFAPEGPARQLSDELELELELSEGVVLSSPQALYREVDDAYLDDGRLLGARVGGARERIADALALLEQQAMVYGVVQGDDVVLALFRTNDAAVVWAERSAIEAAAGDTGALARRVIAALAALHERRRLPDDELVALGLLPPAPVAPPPSAAASTTDGDADAAGARLGDDEEDDEDGRGDELPLPAGLDRVGRLSVSYAPSLLYYRACQPADPAAYVPFSCAEKPGVPSTEVVVSPFGAPLAGSAQLELFPLPFVGVELGASLLNATLAATLGGGDDVTSLSPDTFQTVAGDLSSALVLRLPFGDAAIGGATSLRAGYHLGFAVTDEVTLDTGRRKIRFPLLPTYFSHHGLLGAGAEVGFGALVRLLLDVDALFGPHLEGPVQVGNDAFAVGARGRLQLDVELGAGFLVTATLEGSGVSVGSSGTVPDVHRYTLALEPYESGQLVLADGRFGIGVGYRY